MNQQQIKQNWQQRGFSCEIWRDASGQVWSNFIHDTDELVMLIEGEIELSFNDQVYHPQVGEEILIPAGVSHTVVNCGNTNNSWFYGYKQI
jgi:quercetin dioxygenase-like cupin family protein